MTDDPSVATKIMIGTALEADRLKAAAGLKNTGRKSAAHVQTLSLAWHPDEQVDRQEMERAADEVLELLELRDHQVIIWAHSDTAHPHIHLVINRVCPNTGRMATLSNGRLKLDQWSNEYEKRRGKILTPKREEKARRRQEARKKYTVEERRAYVEQRRKETEKAKRPDNTRWRRVGAAGGRADARAALQELEAALEQNDAAETALSAAAHALETAQRDLQVPAPRYRFTEPSEPQRRAMEVELRAAEDEEFFLIPPLHFDPDQEAPGAFAARMARHRKQLAAAEEKTAAAFADALPVRMASLSGLRAMFAELKGVAVKFGARLRDRLFEMAVNHLEALGQNSIAGFRTEASKLSLEAKEIKRQAEHTAAEAARLKTGQLDPPPAPRPTTRYDGP